MSTPPGIDLAWLGSQFPKLSGLSAIGRGGQKQVLSATHADFGAVVLKVYHPHGDLQRIVREIEATKQFACAHVPDLYDFGTLASPIGQMIWVIERRVPGLTLRVHLASGPLPSAAVLKIALDVLRPLAAAETARKVHRDVKPENVMYDTTGNAAYLLDFGLVRALDQVSLTATAQANGPATPGYAPLEQLTNQKREIDARADLFGLGVTLYECCEGRNPLLDGATDVRQVINRTENMPLPRIARAIEPTGEFADLVYTMTRPRRDHRLSTVAEALAWMEAIAAGTASNS